jgi:nucleoid-associated protein YgaU
MYIDTNRLRRALAAVAFTTFAGLALAAAGVVQAEMNATPDPGPIHVAAGSHVDASPGSARDSNAKRADQTVAVVERYEVAAGDSFWAIAEHQLPDDASAGEVSELTEVLIEYNAPRLGYDDMAMIKPGDVVGVVAAESAAPAAPGPDRVAAPASHVVVAGDSYWAIAESVLGDDATRAEVLAKTEKLMALNSARLGSDDASMIHPGDVVYLAEVVSTPELIVREDARVLVAAAEQMTSKPTPDATVREDARVLVAAAEDGS